MRRYEKKKDEEIRNYDPFGRGGGGAPMRDKYGNIIGEFPLPPPPPTTCLHGVSYSFDVNDIMVEKIVLRLVVVVMLT